MEVFDIIHGPIKICQDAKKIIDTPEYQRLRNIKQLGCVSFVFPCATHTRFEHSLGVSHLGKILIESFPSTSPQKRCEFVFFEFLKSIKKVNVVSIPLT